MQKKQYEAEVKRLSGPAKDAWLHSLKVFASAILIEDLVAAIDASDFERIYEIVTPADADMSEYWTSVLPALTAGGVSFATEFRAAAVAQDVKIPPLAFDSFSDTATQWMRERRALTLESVVRNNRAAVAELLKVNPARNSIAPFTRSKEAALQIVGRVNRVTGLRDGGILGLTEGQTKATVTALDELLSGDPAKMKLYLQRTLRDKRFDRVVLQAIKDEIPVPKNVADRLVHGYRVSMLNDHAAKVARAEVVANINEGRAEMQYRVVDDGLIQPEGIENEWNGYLDDRIRHSHATLYGQRQPIGKPFITEDGIPLRYPGDGPPKESFNCRCWLVEKIDFLKDHQEVRRYSAQDGYDWQGQRV